MGTPGFARAMVACNLLLMVACLGGCAFSPPVSRAALVQHRSRLNAAGLRDVEALPEVAVSAQIPESFDLTKPHVSALYSHQQWRTPTRRTATGVIHVNTVFPFSTKAVAGIAINEYAKRAKDKSGKIQARWTDNLGREWFEAQDGEFHVRGYVMNRGADAWLAYVGWRYTEPLEPADIELATRSLDTILPLSIAPAAKTARAGLGARPSTQPTTRPLAATTRPAPNPAVAALANYLGIKQDHRRGAGAAERRPVANP